MARTNLKTQRLVAAGLFSAAAALFLIAASVILPLVETLEAWLMVLSSGILAAALAGWIAAPKLIKDAQETMAWWRGFFAGAVITMISYVIGVLALSTGAVFIDILTGGPERLDVAASGFVIVLVFGLYFSFTYYSPAIVFGGVAGLIFYHVIRSDAQDAI